MELGARLGAIDIERGAKVSGARFFFLTGVGALLELALQSLAVAQGVAAGLIPMIPPALVLPPAMEGTGFLGAHAAEVYRVDEHYLVGTSEVPLAAYHSNEILDAGELPLRYLGISPCFRREAGSYGKDTKGIIRVHQFDKIEMFSFVEPDAALAEHERLLAEEEKFLQALELPYRVIDVAAGDLGLQRGPQVRLRGVASVAAALAGAHLHLQLHDLPGAPARHPPAGPTQGGVGPVATLNGTLCAMPRTIVAILENHQQADGSVHVPAALQPYLGREVLTPAVSAAARSSPPTSTARWSIPRARSRRVPVRRWIALASRARC